MAEEVKKESGWLSEFFDLSASDIVGAYVKKEQMDADAKIKQLQLQAEMQQAALNRPEIDSMQDAVNSGYAANKNQMPTYWDRIPKPLLYGSAALLGTAVLIKVLK